MYLFTAQVQQGSSTVYSIQSVIIHAGDSLAGGHYYAYCKREKGWFLFNDETVVTATWEEILQKQPYIVVLKKEVSQTHTHVFFFRMCY